ncbi:MAG: hypothetical protein JW709_08185 [Sedimentisphaerales bacterium]|nr:hypothetical protein [Sedimentisphaerales bacterium]
MGVDLKMWVINMFFLLEFAVGADDYPQHCLARLVGEGKATPQEAEKWANHPTGFLDELQQVMVNKKE